MNPPRAPGPSRFIRGRGRGGGAYRPYFYFKRNGRTIPAHGHSVRGGNRGGNRGAAAPPIVPCSFLRPQFYAAPDEAQLQVTSMAIETPMACPGWRLYFYKDSCEEDSELYKRIKVMESHFSKNATNYDFLNIQRQGYFVVKANIVRQDERLLEEWPSLMDDLLCKPVRTLTTFCIAMHTLATIAAVDASLSQEECTKNRYVPKIIKPRKIYARPVGFLSERPMSIVGALEVDQFYCIRGIVSSVGSVDASSSWIAYKCAKCQQEQALKQNGYQVSRPYSCKRQDCLAKAGFIELRSSPFTRITAIQMIRLREVRLNESVDTELISKNGFNVELRHDLVDTIHLGQEVVVSGILRMRPLEEQQEHDKYSAFTGQMEIYMKAASIVDAKEVQRPFSPKDVEAITLINSEPDIFKLLVHSLAPEVHGFEMVKAGVLLSLIGGAGTQLHDEEEVNVLLVGDPGVGKSNIIHMCSKISNNASLVQAKRGASGNSNKLTVAVRGRSNCVLESGPVISARNGHCSLDDIDRLTTQQEAFMNALQSQLTCMAYPSLLSTFSICASIIATANSMRGHYDQSKLLTENIRIPSHLLSEFHLVFVLLDKPNKEMDTSLSEHVRALHAGTKKNTAIADKFNRRIKTNDSMNMTIDNQDQEEEYDLSERLKLKPHDEAQMDLLPVILMKKFIAYSRQQVKPLFIDEASEELKKFYLELRQQSEESTQYSISSNHLNGLIRLCQARARIDFSSEVRKVHVRDVMCIVKQSNDDMALGNYVDINPATAVTGVNQRNDGSGSGNVRKFVQMLQKRSGALSRRIFEFDELKDMARRVGISCGVTNLVDIVNLQGILLKRGPNMYEVMMD